MNELSHSTAESLKGEGCDVRRGGDAEAQLYSLLFSLLRKARLQASEAADYIAPTVGKHSERDAGSQLTLSSLSS